MNKPVRAVNNGKTLPTASLRLLAPPLRLVSAAVWKVMQKRDAMHYGKLEEFVTTVSETVPGLLTYRHQAKLTVGLQARVILEQLRVSLLPDPEVILSHLNRLRAPTLYKGKRKDQKVELAVQNFHSLIQTLLKNPAGRIRFFQEDFESQYGPRYDCALEKLLWEFLTRLDQLLPVPNLAQTVSWLAGAPAVLEECARAASQPQLLRILLQHEICLGHLDSAASIPSSIGDSILSSLSLPPSGKVQHSSSQSGSTTAANRVQSPGSSTMRPNIKQTRGSTPQIAPVIGSICSKDLPQCISANDNMVSILEQCSEEELVNAEVESYSSGAQNEILENITQEEHRKILIQTPASSEEEDEDEGEVRAVTGRRKRHSSSKQKRLSTEREVHGDRKIKGDALEDPSELLERATPDSRSQEDLPALLTSCMKCQLRVVIPRLDIGEGAQHVLLKVNEEQATKSLRLHVIKGVSRENDGYSVTRKRKHSNSCTPEKHLTCGVEKQTCSASVCPSPVIPVRVGSSAYRIATVDQPPHVPSEKDSSLIQTTEDIVTDSEDEALEDVKEKVFKKHYYKTQNDTYIPTLQEFWCPPFFRRDLVSPGNGSR